MINAQTVDFFVMSLRKVSKPRFSNLFSEEKQGLMSIGIRYCSKFLSHLNVCKLPSARLTLHSTKVCTKLKIFRKKIFFGTKVTSEAVSSICQNLKVTRQ